MNYRLPFYGQKGTIKTINEDDRYYLVKRYGVSEKEVVSFNVPKNDKNYKLLMENYYNDLKGYLVKYANKYECYKATRLKKNINMNVVSVLTSLSIIMLATSVPLLLTHEMLGYLGVFLDVLSVPMIAVSTNLRLKNANNKKKINFINVYDGLEHQLRLYDNGKSKKYVETKYNGLTKDLGKEPVRDLVKILEKRLVS